MICYYANKEPSKHSDLVEYKTIPQPASPLSSSGDFNVEPIGPVPESLSTYRKLQQSPFTVSCRTTICVLAVQKTRARNVANLDIVEQNIAAGALTKSSERDGQLGRSR